MATLTLPLQRQYFEAIRARRKPWEYRLVTPYWQKRLEGRAYDAIELTCGYPKREDKARRITLPWKGYRIIENFTHPHFGPAPVTVFAINVAHYQITPWSCTAHDRLKQSFPTKGRRGDDCFAHAQQWWRPINQARTTRREGLLGAQGVG
jgi:hypothetical protein